MQTRKRKIKKAVAKWQQEKINNMQALKIIFSLLFEPAEMLITLLTAMSKKNC
jgi:hypothetical protein